MLVVAGVVGGVVGVEVAEGVFGGSDVGEMVELVTGGSEVDLIFVRKGFLTKARLTLGALKYLWGKLDGMYWKNGSSEGVQTLMIPCLMYYPLKSPHLKLVPAHLAVTSVEIVNMEARAEMAHPSNLNHPR